MKRAALWTVALSACLACTSSSASSDGDRGRPAAGVWGGSHIRLDVAEDGTAAVELDCAHGTVSEPILPGDDGTFRAAGSYVQERPGPVREGQEDTGRPAHYAGRVEDGRMTLTITLTGSGDELGPFELIHGKTPRLTKCL